MGRFAAPVSWRKAAAFAGPPLSILTGTTAKSLPPSLASSLSSAGISSRQGTHQVAQRFKSTTLPAKSWSVLMAPSAVKEKSGKSIGFGRTTRGAMAPLLRFARGRPAAAVARGAGALSGGEAAGSPDRALSEGEKLHYTVPNPAIAASSAATR